MQPDFDGRTYALPDGSRPNSGLDVLRWMATRKKARWPRWIDNPPPDPLVPRVSDPEVRCTLVNHATVLVQLGGVNLLTDPVWARHVSPMPYAGPARHRAPGIAFDELPPIDAVLVSHGHYDHLCTRTLARLAERHRPRLIAPLGHGALLQKVTGHEATELGWWDATRIDSDHGSGIEATLVPARHWTARGLTDRNRALWGGFTLRAASGSVYFAGDTGYGDGAHFRLARQRLGPFDLALLPIGAYEPRWFMKPEHMNPTEAVQAFRDLDATTAMAIHFGTFQLTDEAHDAPVEALKVALDDQGVPAERFRALLNGQAMTVNATTG